MFQAKSFIFCQQYPRQVKMFTHLWRAGGLVIPPILFQMTLHVYEITGVCTTRGTGLLSARPKRPAL